MAAPTDFLRLYQELGLTPGATIEEIRQAYRRRVSELHPDRAGMLAVRPEEATARLQHITQLYNAALQFHRQHGRTPGSSGPARQAFVGAGTSEDAARMSTSDERGHSPTRSRTSLYAIAGLACALGALAWLGPPRQGDAPAEVSSSPSGVDGSIQPAMRRKVRETDDDVLIGVPTQLDIGLSVAEVELIEDAPVTRNNVRWDYGPSWIAFEKGKVVDWYSSPLRPLRRATARPVPHSHQQP
jgi:hypothetical protein